MNTFFLATVLGWFLVVFGLFLVVRHEHVKAVAVSILSQPGLFFVVAIYTFIMGLLMVVSHNIWLVGWPVVVTVLCWLVLLSGLVRLICPDTAMKMGNHFVQHSMRVQVAGAILLAIGVFLLFHVYYLHL